MRNPYHWIMSSTMIPETIRFDDPNEIHLILESSLVPLRTFLVIGGFVLWIAAVVLASRMLAPSLGISAWVAQVVTQPIGMLAGFYWFFNYGLRRPFQQALRAALQRKGIPICMRCGYDLTGNESGTCPECGTEVPSFHASDADHAK